MSEERFFTADGKSMSREEAVAAGWTEVAPGPAPTEQERRRYVFSDGAENERLYRETVAGLRKLGHPEAAHVLESEQFILYGNPEAEQPVGVLSMLCEEIAPPHVFQPEPLLNFTGKPLEEVVSAFAIPADTLKRSEYLARHPEILEELDGGIQVAGGFIDGSKP